VDFNIPFMGSLVLIENYPKFPKGKDKFDTNKPIVFKPREKKIIKEKASKESIDDKEKALKEPIDDKEKVSKEAIDDKEKALKEPNDAFYDKELSKIKDEDNAWINKRVRKKN